MGRTFLDVDTAGPRPRAAHAAAPAARGTPDHREIWMDDLRVKEQLTDFVLQNYLFGDTARIPGEDDGLVEEGIIDSTGVLELIEFLESQFDITVSEEETVPENLGTIANLTRYVTAQQRAAERDVEFGRR